MQTKLLFTTCLSLAALPLGCDQGPTNSEKMEQVSAAGRAAAPAQSDYTYAQRAEFKAKMQSQVAEINQDIDLLATRIEQSSAAVKAEAAPRLKALRDQAAVLNKQIDEADHATESTWETVKRGTQKTYDAMKAGFQESRQWLSEKIAP
jgi:phage host-nuclease inhibitor protein Gam